VSGLVLSGGGARGAYEAGALRFVYGPLAARIGRDISPSVICGTSVGALTGAWVAALGMEAATTLSYFWRELEPQHIYRMQLRDLVSGKDAYLSRTTELGGGPALFDPAPLYEHVRHAIPWGALHERLDRGVVRAFACAATDVASGRCIQFVDGDAHTRPELPGSTPDVVRQTANTTMQAARIGPEHVLASAAIPFVFPPVRVGGRWMVDGALRQNTPLGPTLQLQCERVTEGTVEPIESDRVEDLGPVRVERGEL
jgi:NTE family protein